MDYAIMDEGFTILEGVVSMKVRETVDICICEMIMASIWGDLSVKKVWHTFLSLNT